MYKRQIHGRDNVDDYHKARYDAVYSRNVSFATDCYIFIKTIPVSYTHLWGACAAHPKDALYAK